MTTAWREFELLVARVEAALAPLGTVVTSPDRVTDLISGNLREVDASIRHIVGERTMLVTLECRDRQCLEDNTWIEQLVTKQRSIGAERTVAVSSRGFSEPALRKAAHFGIDARIMRDIQPEHVLQLLRFHYHESCYRSRLHGLRIRFWMTEDSGGEPPALSADVLAQLKANLSDARVFQRASSGLVSWNDAWKFLQQQESSTLYSAVPDDGSTIRTNVQIRFSDDVFVDTVSGPRKVAALDADVELFVEQRKSVMSVGRTSEYSAPTNSVAQAVSYSAEASFGLVDVLAVTATDTRRVHLSLVWSDRARKNDITRWQVGR